MTRDPDLLPALVYLSTGLILLVWIAVADGMRWSVPLATCCALILARAIRAGRYGGFRP